MVTARNAAVRPAETSGVITGGRKLPFGNNYVTWLYVIASGLLGELFNPGPTDPPTASAPGATRPGYPLYLRNYMSVIRPRLWITLWTTFSVEGERVVSRAFGPLLHRICGSSELSGGRRARR